MNPVTSLARGIIPLAVRKRAATWLGRQSWLPERQWRSVELIRDLAQRDPEAYHRFLWSRHLGYAESYEPQLRFGSSNLRPERELLLNDLRFHLGDDVRAIQSVLEVGCSLGHLLRAAETELFTRATVLDGFDIDEYAVHEGERWLQGHNSRIRLMVADMDDMDATPALAARYDVVMCAGVLMYVRERAAARVVHTMLRRTGRLLVLSGLACPSCDNRHLPISRMRASDGAFIHNLDDMIGEAGGSVVFRRWSGTAPPGWNAPYFLFCRPGA